MIVSTQIDNLTGQVRTLLEEFSGPFPYNDCRKALQTVADTYPGQGSRYQDLISDLDSYFYIVDAYAGGALQVMERSGKELVTAREMLKNSFFQAHPKYKPIEWMINQINTPKLYQKMALSDQLRQMLLELFMRQVQSEQQASAQRQKQMPSALS